MIKITQLICLIALFKPVSAMDWSNIAKLKDMNEGVTNESRCLAQGFSKDKFVNRPKASSIGKTLMQIRQTYPHLKMITASKYPSIFISNLSLQSNDYKIVQLFMQIYDGKIVDQRFDENEDDCISDDCISVEAEFDENIDIPFVIAAYREQQLPGNIFLNHRHDYLTDISFQEQCAGRIIWQFTFKIHDENLLNALIDKGVLYMPASTFVVYYDLHQKSIICYKPLIEQKKLIPSIGVEEVDINFINLNNEFLETII